MSESKLLKDFPKTEKATMLEKEGKYIFIISSKANKIQIKKEVERLYKVKVKAVNVMRRKAVVTLQKGYKIQIL